MLSLPLATEARTGHFWLDAAGKYWPIYAKRLDVGALPNATTKNTAHGITALKLDGHFKVRRLRADNATNVWDELTGVEVLCSCTVTNFVMVSTADLSTHLRGDATIEYCKTTD